MKGRGIRDSKGRVPGFGEDARTIPGDRLGVRI